MELGPLAVERELRDDRPIVITQPVVDRRDAIESRVADRRRRDLERHQQRHEREGGTQAR